MEAIFSQFKGLPQPNTEVKGLSKSLRGAAEFYL